MSSNEEEISLSKIDVAVRQLRMAVRLFFQKADPIPIETITGASCGILLALAKRHGIKSILHDSVIVAPEGRKEWITAIREAQNFFKHADKDADVIYTYKPRTLHFRLMEACDLFRQLVAGKHVPVSLLKETVTFEIWFSFKYRHLLSDPEAFRKTMPLKLHDINPEDYTLFCDTLGIRQD